jgi:hypothetical protein
LSSQSSQSSQSSESLKIIRVTVRLASNKTRSGRAGRGAVAVPKKSVVGHQWSVPTLSTKFMIANK